MKKYNDRELEMIDVQRRVKNLAQAQVFDRLIRFENFVSKAKWKIRPGEDKWLYDLAEQLQEDLVSFGVAAAELQELKNKLGREEAEA